MNTSFEEQLNVRAAECEKIITGFLPAKEGYAKTVIEAMNYSVLAGGKRLRPMLIMETGRMYGVRDELLAPFMAALEMIHTYSLVHDDLPAMDNDEMRRGRKTTWNVYGEDMAVIAGDGLLNYAYETALKAFHSTAHPQETERVIRAMEILTHNAGIYGMVGGQCADLEADKRAVKRSYGNGAADAMDHSEEPIDEAALLTYIHDNKTAALIRSGFTIGAVLAGAPQEDIASLAEVASEVGLAFQIQDDILDVIGDAESMGKTLGKDAEEGKTTYVSLYGLEASQERVTQLSEDAVNRLDSLSVRNSFLKELVLYLAGRKN